MIDYGDIEARYAALMAEKGCDFRNDAFCKTCKCGPESPCAVKGCIHCGGHNARW